MKDLINVPDFFLNRMLREKPRCPAELGELRTFEKINLIKKAYAPREAIEKYAAEYLYTHYGPVEIRRLCPGSNHTEIAGISETLLEQQIKKHFKSRESGMGMLAVELDKDIDFHDGEIVITKIMPMYEGTAGNRNNRKLLTQIAFYDKYVIFIDDDYQLQEIKRMKVVNTVLDLERRMLQIRSDHVTAEKLFLFFEKILGDFYSFKELLFDEQLIKLIKSDERLKGKTYEYIGKRHNFDVSQKGIPQKSKSIIETKSIKKTTKSRPETSIKSSPDFPTEVSAYPLESDLFNFPVIAKAWELSKKKKRFYKLQLTMERSRIYFRRHPPEYVIDHVLDNLIGCLPPHKDCDLFG